MKTTAKKEKELKDILFQEYKKNVATMQQTHGATANDYVRNLLEDVKMRNVIQTRALEDLCLECRKLINPNEIGLKFATFINHKAAIEYFKEALNDNHPTADFESQESE